MRYGNAKLVMLFGFLAPIIGTLLLVLFGFAKFNYLIFMAAALVVFGAFIASDPARNIFSKLMSRVYNHS